MNNIEFRKTDDNSTGLYNKEIKDIFHSKTGALKEAYEKFVNQSFIEEFKKNGEINVLDICYGVGYNTKAILTKADKEKINIDCFEINEELILLSSVIEDRISDKSLKIFIISQIIENGFEIKNITDVIIKYCTEQNKEFFTAHIIDFIQFIMKNTYKNTNRHNYISFLHNIYYSYISNNTNYAYFTNKYKNAKLNFYIGDARLKLNLVNNIYDIVFLDAFSPQIDPTLWTLDFLSVIKNKMTKKSVLLTYSKSTPYRAALLELGFYVGKTLINSFDMGTVASFDKNKILFPLSDFDLELINTKSGICYRDKFLNLSPQEILAARELEMKYSDRISHTKFLKLHNNYINKY